MDTGLILVVIILALVAIAAFVVYQRRSTVEIKGPLGTGIKVQGSNEPTPQPKGAQIEDAVSRKGAIKATDQTGAGATVKHVEAEGDISATSTPPKQGQNPKAQ